MQGSYKDKRKGRSAGEMLTGIRKTLKVKKIRKENRDIISMDMDIEGEDWKIISVYNRMGKKEYLKSLEGETEKGGWKKLIIGGDFNARTEEQGSIAWNENEEEESRSSKDKIINRQGKDLLAHIEQQGFGIMNGNIREDEGKMTFIRKKGSSVIDYAICNAEAQEEINKMEIGDTAESDHKPIEVTLVKMIDRKKRKEKKEGKQKTGQKKDAKNTDEN